MNKNNWYLSSEDFIFCIVNDKETWTPIAHKKKPEGAVSFELELQAIGKIDMLKKEDNWEVFINEAIPVQKEWK